MSSAVSSASSRRVGFRIHTWFTSLGYQPVDGVEGALGRLCELSRERPQRAELEGDQGGGTEDAGHGRKQGDLPGNPSQASAGPNGDPDRKHGNPSLGLETAFRSAALSNSSTFFSRSAVVASTGRRSLDLT